MDWWTHRSLAFTIILWVPPRQIGDGRVVGLTLGSSPSPHLQTVWIWCCIFRCILTYDVNCAERDTHSLPFTCCWNEKWSEVTDTTMKSDITDAISEYLCQVEKTNNVWWDIYWHKATPLWVRAAWTSQAPNNIVFFFYLYHQSCENQSRVRWF